ncbi:Dot/Icm T4SS effector PI-3-phosphatase SidP [Legionella spiritensis]|uniref:Dot/Icm T4SS effector PI-3-phosphatase SidP n=1 Tax=Legionella spiritensis TaxID=452 RepID=UPI000F6D6506|nr:Dot/Icm T4SS effector PI-3-phosphatase SidP [Legionella spiritensis]VEG91742.1 oxidoreductase [Legionella spiritensis]
MGKKTILRLEKGVVLNDVQLKNLQSILGDSPVNEDASVTRNLQRNHQLRADSLKKAFQFIEATIPKKSEFDTEKYLQWCAEICPFPENAEDEEYKKCLTRYGALLTDALVDYWEWDTKDGTRIKEEAIELLNKAEQYVVMQEGRADLATLIPDELSEEGGFILLWDEQLPPLVEETRRELEAIKASVLSATPPWFRQSGVVEQLYFYHTPAYCNNSGVLRKHYEAVNFAWMKAKAERSLIIEADLQAIRDNRDLPKWFTGMASESQKFFKSWLLFAETQEDINKGLAAINSRLTSISQGKTEDISRQLSDIRKLPYWYLCLSEHEQLMLKTVLAHSETVDEAMSFLPSRLRTIPGVANFAHNHFKILDNKLNILHSFDPYRASHLASRDVQDMPPHIRELHVKRNLARLREVVGEDRWLLIQTLISPNEYTEKYAGMPDHRLAQDLARELEKTGDNKVCSPNHPFNYLRYLDWTSHDNPQCTKLLKLAYDNLDDKFIKEEIALLELDEISASELEKLVCAGKSFIAQNENSDCYASLRQLIANLEWQDMPCSPDEVAELIKQAFEEAKALKEGRKAPVGHGLVSRVELNKRKLIDLFHDHYALFKEWQDWQPLLTRQLYVRSNKIGQEETFIRFQTKMTDLVMLCKEYENVLNSGWGTGTIWDYCGRELFLSSLESLIITHTKDTELARSEEGISFGSCVSGKDRKSIELIHTAAMFRYKKAYGRWPSFGDTGSYRANFVDIVATLYVSGHFQEHAGQNAPGSNGTKTPDLYWPADIAKAICAKLKNERALERDDMLATYNEVSRIGKMKAAVKVGYASSAVAVLRYTEEQQQRIIDLLTAIVKQPKYWHKKTSVKTGLFYSAPTGIAEIDGILTDETGKPNSEILTNIFHAVFNRPVQSWFRDSDTQELYNLIKKLSDPRSNPGEVLDELETFKTNSYVASSRTDSPEPIPVSMLI